MVLRDVQLGAEGGVVKPLGRKIPTSWEHLDLYPLRALIAAAELLIPPDGTEKGLGLPWWWKSHDQGSRSSCVGHGLSAERSITNHRQRLLATGQDLTYRYDSPWLYDEALKVDEWPGEADEGTSLRAGYDVLVMQGHRRVQRGVSGPITYEHGVTTYRWAQNVDEIRAAIFANRAVAIGVSWYYSMFLPFQKEPGGEHWVSIAPSSKVAGEHCVCLYRFSDRRESFRIMNSWGADWPPSWLSYADMERLLSEQGEAAVVTDR